MQSKKILIAVAAISLSLSTSRAATMIYNNGVNYSGFYLNPGASEVGDEIFIASGYTASTFRFEYFGSGFHTGGVTNEQFRLQFYNNNGAELGVGTGTFLPNSTFYDSGWQSLDSPVDPSGRNTYLVDLSYTNIMLPDHFTWSVQFQGIDAGEIAGLSIYHPPTIGFSENDYWFRGNTDWELRGTNGFPISFGAQITAVPEPSTFALAIAGGLCGMVVVNRRKRTP